VKILPALEFVFALLPLIFPFVAFFLLHYQSIISILNHSLTNKIAFETIIFTLFPFFRKRKQRYAAKMAILIVLVSGTRTSSC